MDKWADYLISEVHYKENEKYKHIEKVKVHVDNGESVGEANIWTRSDVISYINTGYIFYTIFKNKDNGDKWDRGAKIEKILVNDTYYLRTDANKRPEDNLDNLPEF
jgi:hypothetical protein